MHDTPSKAVGQGPTILEYAEQYLARGWSIIPIRTGSKMPAVKQWKPFQEERATADQLRRWFFAGDNGLAVIFGDVSGGLVCRDFDTMESYDRWAAAHRDLAAALPTVATARGRHVYCRSPHRGIVKFDDGELRGAGYCLLPPSRHPDGPVYRWLIPLPEGELPMLDCVAAGFHAPDLVTESTECTECTEDYRGRRRSPDAINGGACVVAPSSPPPVNVSVQIERAILESLPKAPGQRNRQVFELARSLKAFPSLADSQVDLLKPYVRRWHTLALPHINTQAFEESWIDFLKAWPKVKFAKGAEPMAAVLARVQSQPMPPSAAKYELPGLKMLVAICCELQRTAGEQPFFLSCRTAGNLLQINHVQASRWLSLLIHDHVVDPVEKPDRGQRRATRFRYLGG